MNYIITGGTGFIGTHLTKLLLAEDANAKVWNLDIVKPGLPLPLVPGKYHSPLCDEESLGSAFVECDVRSPIKNLPFTPGPDDIIFNFAAVHRTPGSLDYDYFETNILGAENVTAFAEKYGIKRIVFTSSIAPYGAAEELKKETTLPTPNAPYGISKLTAEKIHQIWQARDAANRQLTIVRPGVVFGKGENGNFTRLYWGIRKHKFAYPGRKDTIKACIYVKELVNFMLYRVRNHPHGVELYNCCYEPAYTIEHICNAMKNVTGLKTYIPYVPSKVLLPAAAMIGCLGAPMGICPARVKKLMISTNISGEKLKACGYPFKYTFEDALADWFKDNRGMCLE
jgi:GlcNAc-P-P-Und epimerase